MIRYRKRKDVIFMKELAEVLKDVDSIKDDQEFVEIENGVVRQYCYNKNFEMTEDDMREIKNRGMDDAYEFWKEEFGSRI